MQCFCIIASDGTLFLDWVEIGNVTPSGNDTYTFNYGPLETIDTVWNGKSVGEKFQVEYGEIFQYFHLPEKVVRVVLKIPCTLIEYLHSLYWPSEWFSTTLSSFRESEILPYIQI